MKLFAVSALMLLAPAITLAQPAPAAPAKPAAKQTTAKQTTAKQTTAKQTTAKQTAAKSITAKSTTAKQATAKKAPVAKAEPPSSRTQLRSATGQVAAGMMAAEAALTPEELAIAERVHVGRIPCELGAFVTVTADAAMPGRFHVEGKGFKYYMQPVATTTGTVRLEDAKGGAIWLQIANKSMLMNQKLGQRQADECMSPEQTLVAEAIKKNPPPSVLEAAK